MIKASRATCPTRRWLLTIPSLMLLLVAVVWVARGQTAGAAPLQPLPFSHQKHLEAGTSCVFCHPGVLRSAVAGLPSAQT